MDDGKADGYDALYRRWEQSGWSATEIDFSVDAQHWNERLSDMQRKAATWNYSMFLVGVHTEGRALPALLHAADGVDERTFLATQVADEARNRVFLERFVREVAGQGDAGAAVDSARAEITWGFGQTLEELERRADALRRRPKDKTALAQAVALCHVVIEGVLAIPGEHFIQRFLDREEILPGFSAGLSHIARDETRHVAFGIRFLSDLIASSQECRDAVIELWNRVLPWTVGVFIPPELDHEYVRCFDFTLEEIYAFGLRSWETRMSQLGIPPEELYLLSLDERSLGYAERARRLLVLVEAGVLGDDRREPDLNREALEILFEGTLKALEVDVARSLDGPIEWDFTDTEAWHVTVTDDHAEAKPGKAGEPALRLEMPASEWAKVAVGRSDARRALLTRRMRVHGNWPAKAKLAKLFK